MDCKITSPTCTFLLADFKKVDFGLQQDYGKPPSDQQQLPDLLVDMHRSEDASGLGVDCDDVGVADGLSLEQGHLSDESHQTVFAIVHTGGKEDVAEFLSGTCFTCTITLKGTLGKFNST